MHITWDRQWIIFSVRWSASKCLQKSGVCINVILSRHVNRSWRNNKCRQFNMKVTNAMPSKCVHLQQRSTSVSRHITTNENRHQEQNLDLLFWKAPTTKNFHEQKFSLNHYVIIFQRKDFSSFFLHVNLLNVKVYINWSYYQYLEW